MTEASEHPFFLSGQVLARVEFRSGGGYGTAVSGYGTAVNSVQKADTIADANVVSSLVERSRSVHRPVLDIDCPVHLIPSSTPGHYHLMIDHFLTWDEYEKLLRALQAAGILESGYVEQSIRQRQSCVRLPWIPKETP